MGNEKPQSWFQRRFNSPSPGAGDNGTSKEETGSKASLLALEGGIRSSGLAD